MKKRENGMDICSLPPDADRIVHSHVMRLSVEVVSFLFFLFAA